jgi:transposase
LSLRCEPQFRGAEEATTNVTRPFSIAYKQKMIERLNGKNAISARQLATETGISQETLSRWLREARSLPLMAPNKRPPKTWSIEEKVRVLAEAAKLTGPELTALLEREGLTLAALEQWRMALDEEGRASKATTKRIRKLERELARKEKALAEAAALLVLKKKVEHLWEDEDDDTDEETEK